MGYPVIRLASDKPALSDNVILNRNVSRLRSVARARNKASGIEVPTDPITLPPRTTALLFTGLPEVLPPDDNGNLPTQPLSSLLSVLEGNNMPAAFFLRQEELLPGAEVLRELVSRSFSVGILLTNDEDPVTEAQACSQLYAQVLHQRIRLVCTAGLELTEEQQAALTEAGFVLWTPALDPDTGALSSGKLLSAAQKALRNAPEQSSLRLYPTDVTAEILPVICSYLLAQNFTASPINEWTAPF